MTVSDRCCKMKGLIVFDDKSALAFFSLDREMEKHIFNRMKQLSGTSVSLLNWNTLELVYYKSPPLYNSLNNSVLLQQKGTFYQQGHIRKWFMSASLAPDYIDAPLLLATEC